MFLHTTSFGGTKYIWDFCDGYCTQQHTHVHTSAFAPDGAREYCVISNGMEIYLEDAMHN